MTKTGNTYPDIPRVGAESRQALEALGQHSKLQVRDIPQWSVLLQKLDAARD